MTQPPEPAKPPELVPGQPLWAAPDATGSAAPKPSKSGVRGAPARSRGGADTPSPGAGRAAPASGQAASGRAASGAASVPPDYQSPRPVQFGTTTPAGVAMPQATTYGRASAEPATRTGGKLPIGLLSVTAVMAFVLGVLVGAAAVWTMS
ncbi:MAG: hypothetical protein ACRDTM_08390 [Micromonosporaceae bacterium]